MSNTRRHAACLAFGLCLITLAVNLQAPLYTAYAELSGYGAAATASAFSGYVLGVLPVLLVLGGLSDRIGRKPPIVVALLLSMVATLVLAIEALAPLPDAAAEWVAGLKPKGILH
ncbi:MFS transporter, partial [Pseudomonas aeruginosa]|nr:MFS transporter [Pseudomonas aeruginosa]